MKPAMWTESEVIQFMIEKGYTPESVDFWLDVNMYFQHQSLGWFKKEE
ncbi:MAG: hypothetical protein ABS939_00235 [Psychrobacillus sp.]